MAKDSKTTNGNETKTLTSNKEKENTMSNESKTNTVNIEELAAKTGMDPKILSLAAGVTGKPKVRSSKGGNSKIVEVTNGLLEVNRILHGVTKQSFGDMVDLLQSADLGIAFIWATPLLDDSGKQVIDKVTKEVVLQDLTKEEAQQAVIAGKTVVERQLIEDKYRGVMNPLRNHYLDLKGKAGNRTGKAKPGKLPKGWIVRYVEGGKDDDAVSFVYVG